MHTRGPGFSDGLKNALNQLELVRSEWVVPDEILAILVLPEGHAAVFERELALEDVSPLPEDLFKFAFHVLHLRQKTSLNDFIDIGTGEGKWRVEPSLNLGKVLFLRFAHVTQHGVHVFL